MRLPLDCLGSVSGRCISFTDPHPDQFDIEDIATGLAHVNRFAGQTEVPYSVAQHSVLCSLYCHEYPYEALMHDATEAYMGDCPRPLKRALGRAWTDIEKRMLGVIWERFGLDMANLEFVKDVDDRMFFTERRDLQPRHAPLGWKRNPYLWTVKPWGAKRAKREFLKQFERLEKQYGHCRAIAVA